MATSLLVHLHAKGVAAPDVYREGGVFSILHRVPNKALERLELGAGKLACSVLRGGGVEMWATCFCCPHFHRLLGGIDQEIERIFE